MNRKDMLRRLKAGEDALELSIEKWRDIVNGKGRNTGGYNCALCASFECKNCPASGGCGSNDNPYNIYCCAKSTKARHAAAVAEVKFLEGLRK